MTMNFGSPYDRVWVGNNQILLFCPFLFTVDFKALCPSWAPLSVLVGTEYFYVSYICTKRVSTVVKMTNPQNNHQLRNNSPHTQKRLLAFFNGAFGK